MRLRSKELVTKVIDFPLVPDEIPMTFLARCVASIYLLTMDFNPLQQKNQTFESCRLGTYIRQRLIDRSGITISAPYVKCFVSRVKIWYESTTLYHFYVFKGFFYLDASKSHK
jgi:hypothetical protein